MIRSFAGKQTELIFNGLYSRRFPADIQRRAKLRLNQLHAATELRDLVLPPSNRLEQLSGDRKGQHSIRINDQWRVCFRWVEGHAYEVEITDYH